MDPNGTYHVSRTSALGLQGLSEGFSVTDDSGNHIMEFRYAMHLGSQEWKILDAQGSQVADMQRHVHMHPTFTIDRPGHAQVTVRKSNFMPTHESWRIEGLEAGDLDVSGDLTDHEFTFTDASGSVVGQTSRQWATLHEGYAVRLTGLDPLVALCAAVAMDVEENSHK